MTLQLDAHSEAVIREKVEAGLYRDAAEAIREAVRLLDEHDRSRQLRAKLALAEEQADRGEGAEFTEALFAQIKRNARRKAETGHQPDPAGCAQRSGPMHR